MDTIFSDDFYLDDRHHQDPMWLENEKMKFLHEKDFNHDHVLERNEISEWIMPSRGRLMAEAKHLMKEADLDQVRLVYVWWLMWLTLTRWRPHHVG